MTVVAGVIRDDVLKLSFHFFVVGPRNERRFWRYFWRAEVSDRVEVGIDWLGEPSDRISAAAPELDHPSQEGKRRDRCAYQPIPF
jgi:hypothetical protein